MKTEYEYILEVFKTGSFSKAAQNLFITQPALSIAIKKIEKDIHMPLFEMYPPYWTPSKEGTFCVIRLNLS